MVLYRRIKLLSLSSVLIIRPQIILLYNKDCGWYDYVSEGTVQWRIVLQILSDKAF